MVLQFHCNWVITSLNQLYFLLGLLCYLLCYSWCMSIVLVFIICLLFTSLFFIILLILFIPSYFIIIFYSTLLSTHYYLIFIKYFYDIITFPWISTQILLYTLPTSLHFISLQIIGYRLQICKNHFNYFRHIYM